MRRLLWEVFRLHAVALRADQFEEQLRDECEVADELRAALHDLAIIREWREREGYLLNGCGKP